ncbi:MAG: ArnT family glycosyltransferase [Planctomycetota bacterium]|jgi:4-amino-4-deoxy-L-arabinose transferase-like glycosyltransferase
MRLASVAAVQLRSWSDRLRRIRLGERELIWILLSVSFTLRLLVWGGVVSYDVPLRGDEHGYFLRAVGFEAVLDNIASAQWPEATDWTQAYGEGKWTPVHSFLISLGMAALGGSVASARFVVVLLSAATTALVYVLARRMAGRRVALIAAGLHACYPTFVAYSHYLWSETTFCLFLVLALILVLRTREAVCEAGRLRSCALAGLATGVCFLIKSSAVFLMPVVPLWLFLRARARGEGARAAAAFVLAWLIPWGAWSMGVSMAEGRFVPTMANSGYALYRGNNPWMPPGLGSYSSPETRRNMGEAIAARVAATGQPADDAARQLALEEIKSRPVRFGARVLRRAQAYWFPYNFALVHLYRGYYPPLAPGWGTCLGLLVVACYLLLIALAGRGLLIPGFVSRDVKLLWLGLVLAMMVPSLLVVAHSRYHVPALVILLPFAALAIDRIRLRLPRNREVAWIAGGAAFLLLCANGVPTLVKHHIRPSSFYSAVFGPLDRIYGLDIHFVDQLAFRPREGSSPQRVTFSLLGERAAFYHTGDAVATWEAGVDPPAVQTLVHCDLESTPLRIRVTVDGDEKQSVIIQPVARDAWQRWQPTPAGLEYRWDPTSAHVPKRVYFPSWPDG